jgi:hypothetical protein
MSKRYQGNIITDSPVEPSGNFEDSAASGVWSLAEAEAYTRGGLWPTAGNLSPVGITFGGDPSDTAINTIQFVSISSEGNASDFGDLTSTRSTQASTSSTTRAVSGGGYDGSFSRVNVIDYITTATLGNAIDFGDLTQARNDLSAGGNNTRGVFAGGEN